MLFFELTLGHTEQLKGATLIRGKTHDLTDGFLKVNKKRNKI